MEENFLILGSKPNSKIPKTDFTKVFSSNSAASKIYEHNKVFNYIDHTCIIGVNHFLGNEEVRNKVINSRIDNLIVRGVRSISDINFKYDPNIEYLDGYKQLKIMSIGIKNIYLNMFIGELKYEKNNLYKLHHLIKCLLKRKFFGVSTGFFSIIYAHLINPEANLILSGIGMTEDEELYDKKQKGFIKRARVDKFMIEKIYFSLRNKLITTDFDLSKRINIKFWQGPYF